MDRSRNGRRAQTTYGEGVHNPRARQRAFLIGAGPNEADLSELRELLRTAGVAVAGELTQRRAEPDPDRYFGRGKLAELKQAIKDSGANLVACDDELKPRQERNLEQALDMPVIDRTAIILDIFADHAHSAEGKLQVELAQLEYNLARMRGLWTHLERLGAGRMDGGIGTRGPGESQIETDRRLARDRISALKRRLDQTKVTRDTMRRERERAGLPTVALAGYTNAGKSTLLNAVTGADVGVRERLFHTLDPTTRSFEIGGRTYLLTDTVGFIRKLPHQLVEAFSATLEEALGADLIVHVADASVPEEDLHEMLDAVDDVLAALRGDPQAGTLRGDADERPRLLALNKVDLLDDERRRELSFRFPRAVQVSGETGEGLEELREAIEARFLAALRPMDLLLPYEEGGTLSELHELAGELERTDTAEGVRIKARVPAAAAARFERFALDGERAVRASPRSQVGERAVRASPRSPGGEPAE
jgi:GTP-binding protein HflX